MARSKPDVETMVWNSHGMKALVAAIAAGLWAFLFIGQIKSGTVKTGHGISATRSDNPVMYWIAVATNVGSIVFLVGLSIYEILS